MLVSQVPRLRGLTGGSPLLQVEHKSRLPTFATSPVVEPAFRGQMTPASFLRAPKPPGQGWAASDSSAYDVAPHSKQNGDQAATPSTERMPYDTLLELSHHTSVKPSPSGGASRLFKTPPPKAAAEGRAKAQAHAKTLHVPKRRAPHLQQQPASILDSHISNLVSPGREHAAFPPSPAASDASQGSHILSQSVAVFSTKVSRGSLQQASNEHQLRRSAPLGQVAFGRAVNNTPNRRQPHPPSSPLGTSHPATPKAHLFSQSTDPSNGWLAGGLTPKAPSITRASAIPSSPGLRPALPASPGGLSSKAAVSPQSCAEGSSNLPKTPANRMSSGAKIPCTPENVGTHHKGGVSSTTPSSRSTPIGSLPIPPGKQTAAMRTPGVPSSRIGAGRTPQTRASTTALYSQKNRTGERSSSASVATSLAAASTAALCQDERQKQAEMNASARIAAVRQRMALENRAGAHQAGALRSSTASVGTAAHPASPTKSLPRCSGAGGEKLTFGGDGISSSSTTAGKLRPPGTRGILQTAVERASVSGPLGATTTAVVGYSGGPRSVSRVRASMPAALPTTQQQSKQKLKANYPCPELSSNTRLQVRGPAGAYKVLPSPASRSACPTQRSDKATEGPQHTPGKSSTSTKGSAAAGTRTQQPQQQQQQPGKGPMAVGSKGTAGPPLSSESSYLAYADMDLVLPPSVEASGLSGR
jgi:hypothetical protein